MGQQLTLFSERVSHELSRVVDAHPNYRSSLRQLLTQYQSDPSLSEQQILQWCGEKLVADCTNQQHEVGAKFMARLGQETDWTKFEPSQVTRCIAQAAMQYLEELKLDLNFHVRFLDCAAKGSVEKLKKIQPFVDLNYQNESGSTALMIACHGNHLELVQHLLRLRVNINLQDSIGWTALMFCARDGYEDIVRLLLSDEYDTDLDSQAQNGINALMCAAEAGHFRIVQALIEHGADVNACTNVGDTALLHSCQGRHTNIVRLLLQSNADVNVTGKHLCSPSLLAARFGAYDILELLIQHGADISVQDDEGRTICHFEYEGQIAAAIQRGVVGRFNKMIIKPTFGAVGMNGHGRKMTDESSSIPFQSRSQSRNDSSSVSSSPKIPILHSTQHPRKPTASTSASNVTDSSPASTTSSSTATHTAAHHSHHHPSSISRSRTPSPSSIPVRGRKSSQSQITPKSSSASAALLLPSSIHRPPVDFRGGSTIPAARSRSRAFQHPSLGDPALTDAALAELEAGSEQLLQRRNHHHEPTETLLRSTTPLLEPMETTSNIIKSARIDSPALDASPPVNSSTPLIIPRSSDNVHQFEEEPDETVTTNTAKTKPRDIIDAADVEDDEGDHAGSDDGSEPNASDIDEPLTAPHPRRVSLHGHLVSGPEVGSSYLTTLDAHLATARSPMTDGSEISGQSPQPIMNATGTPHADTANDASSTSPDPSINPILPITSTPQDEDVEVNRAQSDQLESQTSTSAPTTIKTEQLIAAPTSTDLDQPSEAPIESNPPPSEPSTGATSTEEASQEFIPPEMRRIHRRSLNNQDSDLTPSSAQQQQKRRARKKKLVEITPAPVAPPLTGFSRSILPVATPTTPTQSTILTQINPFRLSSTNSSPVLQPSSAPTQQQPSPIQTRTQSVPFALISPHSRQSQQTAVDLWLMTVGFDSVSRSALNGFTFADLQSLDLNDCSELVGERVGPRLYGLIKQRTKDQAELARKEEELQKQSSPNQRWIESALDGWTAAEMEQQQQYYQQSTQTVQSAPSFSSKSIDRPHIDTASPTESITPSAFVSPQLSRPQLPIIPIATALPVAHPTPKTIQPTPTANAREIGRRSSAITTPVESSPSQSQSRTSSATVLSTSLTSSPTYSSTSSMTPTSSSSSTALVSPPHIDLTSPFHIGANPIQVVNDVIAAAYQAQQMQQERIHSSPMPATTTTTTTTTEVTRRVTSETVFGTTTPSPASSSASVSGSSSLAASPAAHPSTTNTASLSSSGPTGYYTKDLINAQKAWLKESLEKVKYTIQGTSKLEEMRKNQPHRTHSRALSRQSAEAASTTKSAWERLGEEVEASNPNSVEVNSKRTNSSTTSSSHTNRMGEKSKAGLNKPIPTITLKQPHTALPSMNDYLTSF